MKRLILPLALLGVLSCSDSTEPNVFGSLTFSYTGGGGGTFTAQGGAPSFDAPSTTVSWAVGYTETGETFVVASKPRTGQQVDLAILRIQRTSPGSEPIDPACDEDGDVACTVMVLSEQEELPAWLRRKPDYSVWQRANLWMLEEAMSMHPQRLTVLALWNGEKGDGPGGTKDLITRATNYGATPMIIDTNTLC